VSVLSHRYFGNVDRRLFWRLVIPGVLGAIVGAYILSRIPATRFRPVIAGLSSRDGRAHRGSGFPDGTPSERDAHLTPLASSGVHRRIGGGGWGRLSASTLMARGNHARLTVGSVNAAEFFVTLAASGQRSSPHGLTTGPSSSPCVE